MALKFIIGSEPLSNWDQYVRTVEGMGPAESIGATQAAYGRYMAVTIAG